MDLTIGSGAGFKGKQVSIPVTAGFDAPVGAIQFELDFDPALLSVAGVVVGTANAGWVLVSNPNTPGKLIVGMFSANGQPLTVGEGQQIAVISFNILAGPATLTTPNLALSNVVFDTATVTNVTDGNFTLDLLGDVDGDGKVSANDAVLVADFAVGLSTLSASQLLAGDVNGDGKVTIFDAYVISQFVNGVITTF